MTISSQTKSKENSEETRTRVSGTDGKRFYVYMLRCSDNSLYTGYTTEPERRIEEHSRGIGSRYTRSRRPVELVYLEEVGSAGEALRLESRIKNLNKKGKLLLCDKYKREEKLSRH